jgi:hypothetical protein
MSSIQTESANASMPAVQSIPTNMLVKGVMSGTSSAPECFINQRFSAKLQAFLISYVNAIYSDYPVSGT